MHKAVFLDFGDHKIRANRINNQAQGTGGLI
jgi:hypothetical protein